MPSLIMAMENIQKYSLDFPVRDKTHLSSKEKVMINVKAQRNDVTATSGTGIIVSRQHVVSYLNNPLPSATSQQKTRRRTCSAATIAKCNGNGGSAPGLKVNMNKDKEMMGVVKASASRSEHGLGGTISPSKTKRSKPKTHSLVWYPSPPPPQPLPPLPPYARSKLKSNVDASLPPPIPPRSVRRPPPPPLILESTPLGKMPLTSVDWQFAMDVVRDLYMSKEYKECSTRSVNILETYKAEIHPVYAIYFSFYAATSLELLAQGLHTSSSKKLPLLEEARAYLQQAEAGIIAAHVVSSKKARPTSMRPRPLHNSSLKGQERPFSAASIVSNHSNSTESSQSSTESVFTARKGYTPIHSIYNGYNSGASTYEYPSPASSVCSESPSEKTVKAPSIKSATSSSSSAKKRVTFVETPISPPLTPKLPGSSTSYFSMSSPDLSPKYSYTATITTTITAGPVPGSRTSTDINSSSLSSTRTISGEDPAAAANELPLSSPPPLTSSDPRENHYLMYHMHLSSLLESVQYHLSIVTSLIASTVQARAQKRGRRGNLPDLFETASTTSVARPIIEEPDSTEDETQARTETGQEDTVQSLEISTKQEDSRLSELKPKSSRRPILAPWTLDAGNYNAANYSTTTLCTSSIYGEDLLARTDGGRMSTLSQMSTLHPNSSTITVSGSGSYGSHSRGREKNGKKTGKLSDKMRQRISLLKERGWIRERFDPLRYKKLANDTLDELSFGLSYVI